jgi:HEAT repeat protein
MTWLLSPLSPTFAAALRDVRARSAALRIAAAERLAAPADEDRDRALAGLLELSADPDAGVRAAVMRALAELQDDRALAALIAHTHDPAALVRELAMLAIAALGGPAAQPALRNGLASVHPEVRFQAIAGLAEVGANGDFDGVASAIFDADAHVRANAARSLENFGARAIDQLRRGLDDSVIEVRIESAMALARLGDAAGAHVLGPALETPGFMLEALDAIASLRLRELREPTAAIAQSALKPPLWKAAAARTLIRLDDPRGVPALRRVLRAFRSTARSYAVHVVGELGVVELTDELLRLTRRLRGTDPAALVEALTLLVPRDRQARSGLEKLARRADDAGQEARRVLATLS